MVKNVPVKCGQRRLLRQFLAAGFQGKLDPSIHVPFCSQHLPTHPQCLISVRREDFIYLPMDPRSRSSRGFAFVNLTTVESAHRFYRSWNAPKGAIFRIRCWPFLKNYPSETPLEARFFVTDC